jgi:hypothetical protein
MLKPRKRNEPNKPTRTKTRRFDVGDVPASDVNAGDYDYEDWMDGCGTATEAPGSSS